MTTKNPTHNTHIIPFEQLGTELARENFWTESFETGIGTSENQFTIERENFGDADCPLLTQVITDDGMRHIAERLGACYASCFREHAEDFDGDFEAFMNSNYGNQVWQDYERFVSDLVPYLEDLDTGRFAVGDRVFNLANHHYGTVRRLEGDTVQLDDGTAAEAFYLLKPSDKIFQ